MKIKVPAKMNKKHKKVDKVVPPPPYLPRNPDLSRELLPVFGISDFSQSVKREFGEFRMVNEFLPSLLFLTNSINQKYNILSPIESFTISGEPTGYISNLWAKLKDNEEKQDIKVFIKRVHLVEPIPAMEGFYSLPKDGCLPQVGDSWKRTLTKIHDMYNEAYVDALCAASLSRLVETGKSPHWARFYGTVNARVEKYMYNITEDIESLKNKRWFKKNKAAGVFNIIATGDYEENKPTLEIVGEETEMSDFETLSMDEKPKVELSDCESDSPSTDENASVEIISERLVRLSRVVDSSDENSSIPDDVIRKTLDISNNIDNFTGSVSETSEDSEDSGSSGSGSSSSGSSGSGSSGSGSTSGSSEDSEDSEDNSTSTSEINDDSDSEYENNQSEIFAEFNDFPAQITFHEHCKDTMDSLLDIEESTTDELLISSRDERWSAWIFQVLAGLLVAQYHFGFVHNDLHTNNVMWSDTNDEYIYYKLENEKEIMYYRVPTYGKLMKIIDFGRASFWLKDRKKLIISDAYADGNDAGGQYNCLPYYDSKEPEIVPNPSFDLCRLAISMFDAIYPEQPPLKNPRKESAREPGRISYETESELYNLLWHWLTDSEGNNILRNPDDSERFPDFDLYKHIAKYSKNAIPREQVTNPYFDKQFRIVKEDIPENVTIWDLPLF